MKISRGLLISICTICLISVSINFVFASDDFFELDDALTNAEVVNGTTVKTYNVEALPNSYLNIMASLGDEGGNYGDGSDPVPAIDYDYKIKNINLRDAQDNQTGNLVTGGLLQSVTIESNGANEDLILAVAKYNGYTLTQLTSYNISFTNNLAVVMVGQLLSGINENTSIKLFVWDAFWGTQSKADPVSIFSDYDIDMSMNFLYNNEYVEKELICGQIITAELAVKSTVWWNKEIILYVATYDSSGKLVDLTSNSDMIISNGRYQFISVDVSLPQTLEAGCNIKAFAWEDNSIKPYINSETIAIAESDYYSNTISNAQFVNLLKTVNGRIDFENDIDYVKFIPNTTGEYLIQATSATPITGSLYNYNQVNVATSNNILGQNDGFLIQQTLVKDQIYYIAVSGSSTSDYSLTISPYSRQLNSVIVTGRSVVASGNVAMTVGNSQSVLVEVIDANGIVVGSQDALTSENGDLNVETLATLSGGEYHFALSQDDEIKEIWNIRVVTNTNNITIGNNEYYTIPISVTNVASLEGITFAVSFESDDFELFDACDYTSSIENGIGEIATGFVNITSVQPTYMLFKSTRLTTPNWSGLVNSVKLKSKRSGTLSATSCAYKVW